MDPGVGAEQQHALGVGPGQPEIPRQPGDGQAVDGHRAYEDQKDHPIENAATTRPDTMSGFHGQIDLVFIRRNMERPAMIMIAACSQSTPTKMGFNEAPGSSNTPEAATAARELGASVRIHSGSSRYTANQIMASGCRQWNLSPYTILAPSRIRP